MLLLTTCIISWFAFAISFPNTVATLPCSNNYYLHVCIFDKMKLKHKIAIGYIRAKFKMLTVLSKRWRRKKHSIYFVPRL
jgi:hypothetical protein